MLARLGKSNPQRRRKRTRAARVQVHREGCDALCDAGEVDLPLIVDWPNRPLQKVDFEIGKPSLTRFRVIARDPVADTTRVELEPVTGRSHQLRVHMASLGHPILGDELYGGEAHGRAERLLLHATDLGLFHPSTVAFMKFHAAPPF